MDLCKSRGGRPGLPVLIKPCGFCGRKATLNRSVDKNLKKKEKRQTQAEQLGIVVCMYVHEINVIPMFLHISVGTLWNCIIQLLIRTYNIWLLCSRAHLCLQYSKDWLLGPMDKTLLSLTIKVFEFGFEFWYHRAHSSSNTHLLTESLSEARGITSSIWEFQRYSADSVASSESSIPVGQNTEHSPSSQFKPETENTPPTHPCPYFCVCTQIRVKMAKSNINN